MTDFTAARIKMVDNQIRTVDVTSHSVIAAFLSVPRESFVSDARKPLAYIDNDIEVAGNAGGNAPRYLMEPAPFAKIVQLAEIGADDSVLIVGSGAGYGAAIAAKLGKSVVALESDAALASASAATLAALGFSTVSVVSGDLEKGHAAKGPYDVIVIEGSIEVLPDAVLAQLAQGGRLVAVIGYGNASKVTLYTRDNAAVSSRPVFNTSVKPLPGFRRAKEFVF